MTTVNENVAASLDAAASVETTYVMSAGDTFNGILDHKFDEDWIRIDLVKGKTYQITLSGRGSTPDKAEDTILKLFDANGNHIITNDDIDAANRIFDSRLSFTVLVSDTCYISAGSYTSNPNTDNSGAYMITVEEIEVVTTIDNTITGTSGSNSLTGADDGENIYGLGGNDTLYGRGGDDELDGGLGNDTLIGGAGADKLAGDQRANSLSGGRGNDTIYGGPGGDDANKDTLDGGRGHDKLFGGRGDDTLYGGSGNDMLKGGPGNDMLEGESGNDILEGGAGADILDGGIGRNTFIFDFGHGHDTIFDFADGRDLIDLGLFGLSGFDDLTLSSGADDVTIDLTDHGGGTILLEGFNIANLDATDFLF